MIARSDANMTRIARAHCTEDFLVVALTDGRTISAPLDWYPRLRAGNAFERSNARLVGDGQSIIWPDLDQELSIETLAAGVTR